jgi:nicotinamidase-related amidase
MRLPPTTALVLIDVQQGFESPQWGSRNNPNAETNMRRLLEAWRSANLPVVHIRHASRSAESPLAPNQPGFEFKEEVAPRPGEPVIVKDVNSAFIGTNLEQYLRERGLGSLVLAGLTTNHCVSTTARMAGNLGFDTWVVADGTATFDRTDHTGRTFSAQELHDAALASLHGEFATVTTTDEILAQVEGASKDAS